MWGIVSGCLRGLGRILGMGSKMDFVNGSVVDNEDYTLFRLRSAREYLFAQAKKLSRGFPLVSVDEVLGLDNPVAAELEALLFSSNNQKGKVSSRHGLNGDIEAR